MPFGAPGFFRDHPASRKPVQLDITFVYENLTPSVLGVLEPTGDDISIRLTDPTYITKFQTYLLAEGIGNPAFYSTDNYFSLSTNLNPWISGGWNPVLGRQAARWSESGAVVKFSSDISQDAPGSSVSRIWRDHEATFATSPPPGPYTRLGADLRDVTGGAYWLATKNPREPPESAGDASGSPFNSNFPYRFDAGRLMVSFSYYQTALTEQARVVSAFVLPNREHIFVGVNSLRIGFTGAASNAGIFGAIFNYGSSEALVVSSFNGEISATPVPLSGLLIEYGSAGNTATNTVTQYTAMTLAQITDGPMQLPGSTFQLANTPHLAYRTSGAVFDITHDKDEIFEAIALSMARYLYILS